MSALAPKSDQTHESEWIEFPDRAEISPASIWALDFEDEITVQTKRAAGRRLEQSAPDTDVERLPEAQPQVRILDESQVLPSEASFATVKMNQEVESTVVNPFEGFSNETIGAIDTSDEESVPEARPRVRILDESQVLPSEASFATVKMNQEVETSVVDELERLSVDRLDEANVKAANRRRRILDETYVLPGEESFASVKLIEQSIDPAYSPLREFFVKSNLNWRGLAGVTLLLVTILAGITVLVWKIAEQNVLSSHRTENLSPETPKSQTEPAPIQAKLPTPQSPAPAAVSNRQTHVNEPVTAASANVPKREPAVEAAPKKLPLASTSESSRKAASNEVKLKTPVKVPRQEVKSATKNATAAGDSGKRRLTTPQRRPGVKESEVSKRAARGEKVSIKTPSSKTAEARPEPSTPSREVPAERPKAEPSSPTVTGGAQRPRTVTPKDP